MITNQRLFKEGNTIILRNTVDISAYVDAAKQANELDNGGWFGPKHDRMQLLGYIPPELWNIDPWLIEAKRAQVEGDMRMYMKHMKTFFRVWKRLSVHRKRATWNGYSAVVL